MLFSGLVMFHSFTTLACKASLSMEFFRKEYWSGLPFPPPGNLPDPGIKPLSPALVGRFFTTGFPGGSDGKNLPEVQETQTRSLDWEYPLEEGMATHSSVLV